MQTLIHVGIGKSGTTNLQDLVFNRHPHLLNVGRPNHSGIEYREFLADIARGYGFEPPVAAQAFIQAQRTRAEREGKSLVLSDEALTAQGPLMGLVADRLHTLCPDAHILITIRNQFDAISSYYANHGRVLKYAPKSYHGCYVSFEEWWAFANEHWQRSYLSRIAYWDMARLFIGAFGRERVHVLLFEERVRAPRVFAEKLAPLLEIPFEECIDLLRSAKANNQRDSARLVRFHAWKQRLLPGRLPQSFPGRKVLVAAADRWLSRGRGFETVLSAEVRRQVENLYAEGNASLAKEYGLDLGTYGYPLTTENADP